MRCISRFLRIKMPMRLKSICSISVLGSNFRSVKRLKLKMFLPTQPKVYIELLMIIIIVVALVLGYNS